MSMPDEIRWDAPLPADHPPGESRLFRTSSLGCSSFDRYLVTSEGRLLLVGNGWHDDPAFEDPSRAPGRCRIPWGRPVAVGRRASKLSGSLHPRNAGVDAASGRRRAVEFRCHRLHEI